METSSFGAMVSAVSAGLLCLVFARALVHKLLGFEEFRATLVDYRVLPPAWGRAASVASVALEALVIVMLLVPALRVPGALLAAGLLAVYGAAIALNLWRGRDAISCGCGGSGQGISVWHVLRNGLLLAIAAAVALFGAGQLPGLAAAVAATACAGVLWLMLIVFDQLLGNHGHAGVTDHSGF